MHICSNCDLWRASTWHMAGCRGLAIGVVAVYLSLCRATHEAVNLVVS